jgi:hypothetical protein
VLVRVAEGNEEHEIAVAVAADNADAVPDVVQLDLGACIVEDEMRRMGLVDLAVVEEVVVHMHHTAEFGYAGRVRTQHALGRKLVLVLRLE